MKKHLLSSLVTIGCISLFTLQANAQVLNEGFESGCPPTGWSISNPDNLTTFVATTAAFNTGAQSAYLDVYDMAQGESGQLDALITPALNLSTATGPSLSFYYAYQMWSDPSTYNTADALSVYASTDGGTTWNSIFNITGNTIVTAAIPFDSTQGFVPVAGDWKLETVDISAYDTATSVQFKFEFLNDWENNFYIDDIMISGGTVGVKNINLDSYVHVYPNPSTGPINVGLAAFGLGQTDITVYNVVGGLVEQISENIINPKRIKLNLDAQPNGAYFVKVSSEKGSVTRKVMLNK